MKRKPQNKHAAASRFNASSTRTKAINLAPPPMRGGFRL